VATRYQSVFILESVPDDHPIRDTVELEVFRHRHMFGSQFYYRVEGPVFDDYQTACSSTCFAFFAFFPTPFNGWKVQEVV